MSLKPIGREPDPCLEPPKVRRLPPSRKRRAQGSPPLRDFQPHALAIEETPPSPFTGILLWSLTSLLLAALIWAYFSELPIMTTAPGKFVTDAHTKIVQSMNAGTIHGIFIKPGDTVSAGQVLVTLDSGVDLAKLASSQEDLGLNEVQQWRILAELGEHEASHTAGAIPVITSMEERLAASQTGAQRSKLAVDRAQVHEAIANLLAGKALLAEYATKAARDRDLSQAAAPLVTEGAMSGEDYTQLANQTTVDEGQFGAQGQQVHQLVSALVAARKQLQEDVLTFRSDRYQDFESTIGKSYDLKSQYVEAAREATMDRLRAPVAGTVQTVKIASLGAVVQQGQTVATIVPRNAPLVVEVDLPAQDVGFVRVGQKTEIKITAYPFEQYGSIPGKVLWVSPTADSDSILTSLPEGESHEPVTQPSRTQGPPADDQTKAAAPPTLYYRIKVQPEQTWLNIDGQHRSVRPGMTVSVDIVTGRRRVLDFFLDPVIKYLRTGLTVR